MILTRGKRPEGLTVGIPRGLLYYRYDALWSAFFKGLGVELVYSEPTSRKVLEEGAAAAVDETCLSVKIFMGHVRSLIGRCDYIFVPRVDTFGHFRDMCVRFQALYDQCRNLFRAAGQKFLSMNVDGEFDITEEMAFLELGQSLGFPTGEVKRAYAAAKREEQRAWREKLRAQEALFKASGTKILLSGHSYVLDDPYVGKPITDFLRSIDVTPIRADVVNRELALKKSVELSPTCKWEISRELLGGIALYRDQVDGIILVSAFPCGPDAMVNELLTRKLKGLPLLNLVLDAQSGAAGVETRLESFVDIIRLKKGAL